VGGHHTIGAAGLDILDKLSQGTGNAQTADRESVRHACLWKATIVLFTRYQVDYEGKREIMRNVASVAELTGSCFAEINEVGVCAVAPASRGRKRAVASHPSTPLGKAALQMSRRRMG
jgi:hypothetical protein